ncbi:uncharacterized protein LOC113466175 isoform X2 [Diaphorina citri]|uniref:Uncharacterized protein LOC113466175 isoform X2 n=1 Tax=Diaphorina citri TaxID=121845 RepID=A0A3Q0IS46_DIACI|nr:uncharacterized protein LOC113466175 isoform X2 [Diaphorina citri]
MHMHMHRKQKDRNTRFTRSRESQFKITGSHCTDLRSQNHCSFTLSKKWEIQKTAQKLVLQGEQQEGQLQPLKQQNHHHQKLNLLNQKTKNQWKLTLNTMTVNH